MSRPSPLVYVAAPPAGLDVPPFLGAAAGALALGALRAALIFGAATAVLMVALMVTAGHGVEHVLLGLGVALGWSNAAWRVESVEVLVARPSVVFALALGHAAGIALDGGINSPIALVVWALVAVAVIVLRPRVVAAWLLVSALGYLAALWVNGLSPREWVRGDAFNNISERILGFILVAAALLAVVAIIRRILWDTPELHGLFRPEASASAGTVGGLTDRELRVIRSLADGRTVAEIAEEFGYAKTTIHDDVASAKKKTGAKSRVELVAIVIGAAAGHR